MRRSSLMARSVRLITSVLLGLALAGSSRCGFHALLALVVRDGRLDGVLGKHAAVDLDRRERELLDDLRIADLLGFRQRPALEPLGRERGAGDGRAATEGLELGVHDAVAVDLDLELHHVAALGSADDARAHVGARLVERADVARVVVVIENLVAVCHGTAPSDFLATGCSWGRCPPARARRAGTSRADA